MLFLRLLVVKMADTDLPKNWEGAVRWFLGGTIVFASGFEAVVLFWEGKYGPAASSFAVALFLMAILIYWDRLKSRVPRVTAALAAGAGDARLWAVMLLALAAFAGIPNLQRDTNTWFAALPLFVGLALFFAGWRYLRPITQQPAIQNPGPTHTIDGQARLDLIHLLDLGVKESTLWMLDRLLETAESPEVTDGFANGPNTEEAHKSREWFIGYARQQIGAGTTRHMEYSSVVHSAQFEAERELEGTPQDKLPSGNELLALRRYMISEFQFKRAVQFLRHQKREVREGIINQRHGLIERLQQRNGGGA